MATEINTSSVVTAKDVADVLHISHRTAERWLGALRKAKKKKKKAPVTLSELLKFKDIVL